jgi:hypothetical protein
MSTDHNWTKTKLSQFGIEWLLATFTGAILSAYMLTPFYAPMVDRNCTEYQYAIILMPEFDHFARYQGMLSRTMPADIILAWLGFALVFQGCLYAIVLYRRGLPGLRYGAVYGILGFITLFFVLALQVILFLSPDLLNYRSDDVIAGYMLIALLIFIVTQVLAIWYPKKKNRFSARWLIVSTLSFAAGLISAHLIRQMMTPQVLANSVTAMTVSAAVFGFIYGMLTAVYLVWEIHTRSSAATQIDLKPARSSLALKVTGPQ